MEPSTPTPTRLTDTMNDTIKTPLDICNMALAKIGEPPITEINKHGAPAPRQCAIHYHPCRRIILCSHRWTFATKFATLNTDFPESRWLKPHTLPLDALRVLDVSAPNWTLRGRTIWSPETNINITYIADVEDCSKFEPHFIEALATRLACKLCVPLTESRKLRDELVYELHCKGFDANL